MKKVLFLLVTACMLVLTSCSGKLEAGNNDASENSTTEKDTGYYDTLSAEQVEYLNTYCFMDEYQINRLTYKELADIFLGTGMEILYNKTSGAYRFGINYYLYETNPEITADQYGSYYATLNNDEGKNQITIDEAFDIVDKDTEIRLEDFLQYGYIDEVVSEDDDGTEVHDLYLPISDYYKNVYVLVAYREYQDGKVWVSYPKLSYRNETVMIFDFYVMDYYRDYVFSCINEEGVVVEPDEYGFGGYLWNTATDSSLVLQYFYHSTKYLNVNESFSVYKITDGNNEYIGEYNTEDLKEHVLNSNFEREDKEYTGLFSDFSVDLTLATGGEVLEPGTYLIKFGIDKENYLYIEDEFVVK